MSSYVERLEKIVVFVNITVYELRCGMSYVSKKYSQGNVQNSRSSICRFNSLGMRILLSFSRRFKDSLSAVYAIVLNDLMVMFRPITNY
jgi:hypothetical protein